MRAVIAPQAIVCVLMLALPGSAMAGLPPAPLVVDSSAARATELPRDIAMNKDAGRGNELFVIVRLGDGRKLPFILDTGSSATILDKSLEPQLGRCLGTDTISAFGVRHDVNKYYAPAMFIGKTPLMITASYVCTYDLSRDSTNAMRPIMGVLGINILKHYCVQLDFKANKIHFLDDEHADKSDWGTAFPLINAGDGCYFITQNLAGGVEPGSLIDTGCDYDGWLEPELFKQWTNQPAYSTNGAVYPHYGTLNGEVYPEIYLMPLDPKLSMSGDPNLMLNGIGLQFLSRNLVTLDFPARTLYLKRTTFGFLTDKAMKATADSEGRSAFKFLIHLRNKGQLPGFSKDQDVVSRQLRFHFYYPDTITFDNIGNGWQLGYYHYAVTRTSKDGPWKLVRAWRTDPSGKVAQEFPVP